MSFENRAPVSATLDRQHRPSLWFHFSTVCIMSTLRGNSDSRFIKSYCGKVACTSYTCHQRQAPQFSICLQANHADLQKQEAALCSRVTALDEEVESLKASLSSAEGQVSDLEQQLASHAETHQATLEALEKQAETLQVCHTVSD